MDKHVFTDKQKKLIAWAAIAIFLLLSAAVGWFIGRPLVRFASRPEEFRQWVDGHGLLGMAAYVGMVFLQVAVAVIPGEPLEISGGYAFGALRGSVLCLLGGVLGSVAVFALVRRFGRELVEIFFPREKLEKLKFLQSSPKRDALFWLIFTVPGTPKDLLCYFAGLTDLSWGSNKLHFIRPCASSRPAARRRPHCVQAAKRSPVSDGTAFWPVWVYICFRKSRRLKTSFSL